jgi:hypothetical protein
MATEEPAERPTVEHLPSCMWRWTVPREGFDPLTGLVDTEREGWDMVADMTREHGPDRVRGPRSLWGTDYHDA